MKWLILVCLAVAALLAIVALIGAILPRSHSASRRARYRQSPEILYEAVAGPPRWRSDVKGSGTLPDGRWWEQDSHGKKVTFELVEDRPPFRRAVRIADRSLPFGGTWIIEISPHQEGAWLRITENGEIYNVIFRFVARFFLGYTTSIETYLRDLGRKFGEPVQIED